MKDPRPLTPRRIEVVDDTVARILRSMTGAQRLAIAFGMNRSMRRFLTGTIQSEHPEWTPERVEQELARRTSGGTR